MTDALRARVEKWYWWMEAWIDPGVVSSQQTYANAVQAHVGRDSRWLDLGCGHSLFPDWILEQETLVSRPQLVAGIDYSLDSLRQHTTIRRLVAGDTDQLPFRDAAFTLITANMVFEHLADPAGALREMHRVLAPGGVLLFHTPNYWHLPTLLASFIPDALKRRLATFSEGRAESDVFPTFYRINTRRAIEHFAGLAGFHLRTFHKVNTSSTGDLFLYGPLAVMALLWRRLLRRQALADLRSNFIVLLQKQPQGAPAHAGAVPNSSAAACFTAS
jgi:ubiquinone/menaquinone biosynthesis C-methylase UbiE